MTTAVWVLLIYNRGGSGGRGDRDNHPP